jgi:hypothetical protein
MEEEKDLDNEVVPEIEAARKAVHIRLVTSSLKEALSHGMAGGELGEMVTSCIVTHDLESAITTAERIGVEVSLTVVRFRISPFIGYFSSMIGALLSAG